MPMVVVYMAPLQPEHAHLYYSKQVAEHVGLPLLWSLLEDRKVIERICPARKEHTYLRFPHPLTWHVWSSTAQEVSHKLRG